MIESSINYRKVIKTITAFDNIISDNYKADISDGWNAQKILTEALDETNKSNSFIHQTVRLLLNKKNEIKINLYELNKFGSIPEKSCLFNDTVVQRLCAGKDKYIIPLDNENIFRFEYFKNLNTLIINGVQQGNIYWSFSLHALLRLLITFTSNIKNIKISATTKSEGYHTWLSYVWNKESSVLARKYTEAGYDIQFKPDHKNTETIVIEKREYEASTVINLQRNQQKDGMVTAEWRMKTTNQDAKIKIMYTMNLNDQAHHWRWAKDVDIMSKTESGIEEIMVDKSGVYMFMMKSLNKSLWSPCSNIASIIVAVSPEFELSYDTEFADSVIEISWKLRDLEKKALAFEVRNRNLRNFHKYEKIRIAYKEQYDEEENWTIEEFDLDSSARKGIKQICINKAGVYIFKMKTLYQSFYMKSVYQSLWSPYSNDKSITIESVKPEFELQYDDEIANGIIGVKWKLRRTWSQKNTSTTIRIEHTLNDNSAETESKENDTNDQDDGKEDCVEINTTEDSGIEYVLLDKVGVYNFKMKIYNTLEWSEWSPYSNIKSLTVKSIKNSLSDIASTILQKGEAGLLDGWMKQRLLKDANNTMIQYRLLWRSSQHGQGDNKFHARCDNKGPTLSIFHTEYNHVFGGYTKIPWISSSSGQYRRDDDVFVYLLRSQFNHDPEVYPIQKGYEKGVFHHQWYGPTYGHRAVEYSDLEDEYNGDMHLYPKECGFNNWKGNTLCGGQTYDESEDEYHCALKECEVFQIIVS